jgi:hypothetical protein
MAIQLPISAKVSAEFSFHIRNNIRHYKYIWENYTRRRWRRKGKWRKIFALHSWMFFSSQNEILCVFFSSFLFIFASAESCVERKKEREKEGPVWISIWASQNFDADLAYVLFVVDFDCAAFICQKEKFGTQEKKNKTAELIFFRAGKRETRNVASSHAAGRQQEAQLNQNMFSWDEDAAGRQRDRQNRNYWQTCLCQTRNLSVCRYPSFGRSLVPRFVTAPNIIAHPHECHLALVTYSYVIYLQHTASQKVDHFFSKSTEEDKFIEGECPATNLISSFFFL